MPISTIKKASVATGAIDNIARGHLAMKKTMKGVRTRSFWDNIKDMQIRSCFLRYIPIRSTDSQQLYYMRCARSLTLRLPEPRL